MIDITRIKNPHLRQLLRDLLPLFQGVDMGDFQQRVQWNGRYGILTLYLVETEECERCSKPMKVTYESKTGQVTTKKFLFILLHHSHHSHMESSPFL